MVGVARLLALSLLLAGCEARRADAKPEVASDAAAPSSDGLADGDIIFHTSRSSQSLAIKLATKSKYTHCGLVYGEGGKRFVYEAIGPVTSTPLAAWIARGEGGHYVVKRLRDRVAPESAAKLRAVGKRFRGLPYDFEFGWSDDRIYCSELVWKVYDEALGIKLAPLQRLAEFDLTNPAVRAKLRERYGETLPLNEQVISPAALADSPLLETVAEK